MRAKRKQARIFWTSFGVSFLCVLFLTAFFYLSTKEDLGIQEAALSMELPIWNEEERFSITFLGEKREIPSPKMQEAWDELLQKYPFVPRLALLIPAKYRAAFGGCVLLWENVQQILW